MQAQPQVLDNFKLLVGRVLSHTITAGTKVSPSLIAQGELVVVDESGVVLDTTTVLAANYVQIAMGRGATEPIIYSKLLSVGAGTSPDIKQYAIKPYVAKVQEVVYVGYNAVTNVGAIDFVNLFEYTMPISFNELMMQETSSLYQPIVPSFTSGATTTQELVCNGLYKNTVQMLSVWSKPVIAAERVISAAGLATTDAGITIVKGANSAVLPNISAAAAVGDYVRLGSQSTDTDPVYKITAISGTTVSFDTAVQVSFIAGAVFRVLEATAQAGSFGIRLTAINQVFVLDSRPAGLNTFQVGISSANTPVVMQVSPIMGNGTYELLRQQEAASWRNQGVMFNYTEFPPVSVQTDLDASAVGNSVLQLGWATQKNTLTPAFAKGQIDVSLQISTLGAPNVYSDNIVGSTISVVDVIDALCTSLGFTSQIGNL